MSTKLEDRTPIDRLEAQIVNALRRASKAEYDFLVLLREFDSREGWRAYGNNDCASWLVWKCKLCLSTAQQKVRVARALGQLPRISDAFAAGGLTYSQVRALTRVATPETDEPLLNFALAKSAEDLERYCSRLRCGNAVDAELIARRQREGRSLTKYQRADGSGTLTIDLPAAELALVMAALEKVAADLPDDPDRSLFAKGADAMVALAQAGLEDDGSSASGGASKVNRPAYEVVVHVDASALAGRGGEADLPLPAIMRLCCDGAVRVLNKNDDNGPGSAQGFGRRRRTVSIALLRALQARDRGCRFPGCRHVRFVDAHHLVHWADGGETSLENLVLLCSHHHTMIHEGGYGVARDRHGNPVFTRPDGRPLQVQSRLSAESANELIDEPGGSDDQSRNVH